MDYVGLDVNKRNISWCMKDGSGKIYAEGTIPRHTLRSLSSSRVGRVPRPAKPGFTKHRIRLPFNSVPFEIESDARCGLKSSNLNS
jgi:hypothetical protein